MIIPDANLLLYAYDLGGLSHRKAKEWWEGLLNKTETVGLCPCVIFGFIRIGTNARAFERPLHIEEAVDIVGQWTEVGCVRLLSFTPEDIRDAMALLKDAGAGGNLTTDAQIAASALRLKATVHTACTDFARFPVTWSNPL